MIIPQIFNVSDDESYTDENGHFIIVCDSKGLNLMKPEDFIKYVECQEVSLGEIGKRYALYCVYLLDKDNNFMMSLKPDVALMYFNREGDAQ